MVLIKSLAQGTPDAPGMAVLYTEHNMDAVFGVADRVLVLIDGLIAACGLPQDMAQNELVRTRYLGQAGGAMAAPTRAAVAKPERASAASTPVLSVQHLNVWYGAAQALFDVSLQLGPGELVVLQGLNGAGKSTLLQAIMGLSPRLTCYASYQNIDISNWPSHQRAGAGLGYVAEDRRLFAGLTVLENLSVVARGNAQATQAKVLDMFPALKPLLHRQARQLSGGEQQMLAIARTLMTEPKCLLLDEPCEGISPLLIEGIVVALLALRAQGMAMLVAEQNKGLADRADRVITLVAGQLTP
jgi:branched-chain amino acid transport system ATP-binding protein